MHESSTAISVALRACSSKGLIVILGWIVSASGQIFRSDFRPQDEIFRPGMRFRPLDEQTLTDVCAFPLSRRNRGVLHCVLGLMMLAVAIGVTVGTMPQKKAGLYILYTGEWQKTWIYGNFFVRIQLVYIVQMSKDNYVVICQLKVYSLAACTLQ